MSSVLQPDNPVIRVEFYKQYRDFFDRAERKRRWTIADDIPWGDVNHSFDPAVADVVESFCAVELYLPDYIAKALPMIRTNRGWSWFHANWGYEESKHSLALGDWLLKSGARTDEQMADLEGQVADTEWNLPHDNPVGMLTYAMTQELATWVHYRNLLQHTRAGDGDPALARLLELIAIDERAHHAFYLKVVKMFLDLDRQATLEQLRRVMLGFSMPAVHLLADSRTRMAAIKDLRIFDEDIFLHDVFKPILEGLDVTPKDLRRSSLSAPNLVVRT